MNTRKRLTATEIIGKKIVSVYEKKTKKVDRFQNRMTFVQLENGAIFNLDTLRYPKDKVALEILSCGHEKSFESVLSAIKNINLNSAIKAIVYSNEFDIDVALLLENDFVLTVGIGEFDMGYSFYKPSEKFRNYTLLQIAS